jgi:hypothetical protein
MTFTLKLNRTNIQHIRKNIEKNAQKVERAALDEGASEGGSLGDETKVEIKKIMSIYHKYEHTPLRRHHKRSR